LWPTFLGTYPTQELAWLEAAAAQEVGGGGGGARGVVRIEHVWVGWERIWLEAAAAQEVGARWKRGMDVCWTCLRDTVAAVRLQADKRG
jgi:hypothetical protein